MKKFAIIILGVYLLLLTLIPFQSIAQETIQAPTQTKVKLGVRILDPFVIKKGETYSGFSYELWEKISKESNLVTSEVIVYPTVKEMLAAVEKKEVDVAIAAISITKEREATVDFSTSMFNSGLSILVNSGGKESNISSIFNNIKTSVFNKDFGILAFIVAAMAFVLSNLVYFIEIRKNPEFARVDNYFEGIFEAFWWGITALFGQQDRQPATKTGRAIAVLWMVFGVIFISFFTAQITSNLTAQRIGGEVNSVLDLIGKKVGTIKGSTSEKYLKDNDYQFTSFTTLDEAGKELGNKNLAAVIYDSPALKNYAKNAGPDTFEVVGGNFTDENYGIALQNGSNLRESINLSLLKSQEDGSYRDLYKKYFGEI
jgi:polar amino acid transport system substrate-binding protein